MSNKIVRCKDCKYVDMNEIVMQKLNNSRYEYALCRHSKNTSTKRITYVAGRYACEYGERKANDTNKQKET